MITVSMFRGENRKITPHLLQNDTGVSAVNCYIRGGRVAPLRMTKKVFDLPITGVRSIWRYIDGASKYWCYSTSNINTVRSPITNDAFNRLYFTGGAYPAVYANDIKSSPFDPSTDFYKLGVKQPSSAPSFVSGHTGGSNYRAYVYTYVSRYGEEGPPSPVLSTSTYASGNVTLTGFVDPQDSHLKVATGLGANRPKIRLYRTNSASNGVGAFQFVKEVYADNFTWGSGQIVDDVPDTSLQEVIPSVDWYPPNASMVGLIGLPIGVFAGFYKNTVYFSEPFLPHAWNPDYEISFKEKIVGLGVIGSSLIVLTDETPYIVNGSHPSNMSKFALSAFFPCLSKEGIVSIDGGVLYPSKEGIILVTRDGCTNLTKDVLSIQDMDSLYPATWRAVFYNGQYIAFYKDSVTGVSGGVVLDLADSILSSLSFYRGAMCVANETGELYVAGRMEESDPAESIQEWEGDVVNRFQFSWTSKVFISPKEINLSVARIIGDSVEFENIERFISENQYLSQLNQSLFGSDLHGEIGGADINEYAINGDTLYELYDLSVTPYTTFRVYCNGVLKFERNVRGNVMFRLPSGFRSRDWQFQITGFAPIHQVDLGGSVRELIGHGEGEHSKHS